MAAHSICLYCSDSYNIYPYVKCIKTGCLFISKESRTENVKRSLQNNCINNSAINGLNERKKKKHAKQLYMVKQESHWLQAPASKLLRYYSGNIKMPIEVLNKTCKNDLKQKKWTSPSYFTCSK